MKTENQHPNDKAYHTLPVQNHSTSVCWSPDVTQALGLRTFSDFPCLLWQLSSLSFSLITIKVYWEHKDNPGKCFTPSYLLWAPPNGLLARLSLWKCLQMCHPPHTTFCLFNAKPSKHWLTVMMQQVCAEGPELRPSLAATDKTRVE